MKWNICDGNDQLSNILTWSSYKIHYSALYRVPNSFTTLSHCITSKANRRMLLRPEKAQILKWTFEMVENVQTKVKYNDA